MAVLAWRLMGADALYMLRSSSMWATKPLLFLRSCFLKPNAKFTGRGHAPAGPRSGGTTCWARAIRFFHERRRRIMNS